MQTAAFVTEATEQELRREMPGEVVLQTACAQGREAAGEVPSGLTTELVRRKMRESRDYFELAWWLDQLGVLLAFQYKERLEELQCGEEDSDAQDILLPEEGSDDRFDEMTMLLLRAIEKRKREAKKKTRRPGLSGPMADAPASPSDATGVSEPPARSGASLAPMTNASTSPAEPVRRALPNAEVEARTPSPAGEEHDLLFKEFERLSF
jgi:hypothetical protein